MSTPTNRIVVSGPEIAHELTVKATPGFGAGREYYNATCGCGWAAGCASKEVIERAHIEHIATAREELALKVSREQIRDAAPELYAAVQTLVNAIDYPSERDAAYIKGRAALSKARGEQQ